MSDMKAMSWIEDNVTMISQKDRKIKKIEQLGKYARATCKSQIPSIK